MLWILIKDVKDFREIHVESSISSLVLWRGRRKKKFGRPTTFLEAELHNPEFSTLPHNLSHPKWQTQLTKERNARGALMGPRSPAKRLQLKKIERSKFLSKMAINGLPS